MPKTTNFSKILIIAVAAVIVIVFVMVYSNNSATPPSPTPGAANTNSGAAVTANSPAETQNPTTTPQTTGATPTPKKVTAPAVATIHLITPVKGDIWKINAQNVISWDKKGGISGSISLIDATTKASVGIILPQVGPNQTSYTWNTRDLLLDRTSPLKKTVVPGTYVLKITFDGNNIQPITSPSFTITN